MLDQASMPCTYQLLRLLSPPYSMLAARLGRLSVLNMYCVVVHSCLTRRKPRAPRCRAACLASDVRSVTQCADSAAGQSSVSNFEVKAVVERRVQLRRILRRRGHNRSCDGVMWGVKVQALYPSKGT